MNPKSILYAALLFVWISAPPAGASPALERLAADNGGAPDVYMPAGRVTPRLITGLSLTLPGRSPAEGALAFAAAYRELLLPGDGRSEVVVTRVVQSPLGPVVQMEQRYAGLPVHGRSLVVSFDRAGRLRTVVCGLSPLGAETVHERLVPGPEAVDLVRTAFEKRGRLRGEPRIETVWLSGKEWVKAHLVTLPGAEPFGDFTFVVIGPEGRVAWAFARTRSALGYAYLNNPVRDDTYQEVELLYLTSAVHLTGEHVEVFNCAGSTSGSCDSKQQLAGPDANGDYLIEPTGANDPNLPDDLFVEVQAYYAINTVYDYFVDIGASPSPLGVGVNYPMPPAYGPNAYYSSNEPNFGGPAILMGQWQTIDLAVDNDVIFHEYGHHVFGEVSSAGMFGMDEYGPVFFGLAFNEATADYFSCSALEDPSMGEYFASRMPAYFPDGYLRNVDNELTCPDGLYGEGHDDGMVWSGFVWELRELLGAEVVDPLYLDVISHFPGDIDFPTATQVFLDRAAVALDAGTVQQIQDLAISRGLADCTRFIEVSRGGHTGFTYGLDMLQGMPISLDFIPAELHYYMDLPAGAESLELHVSNPPFGGADVVLLVRADRPVEHSISMAGLTSTYDFMLEDGGTFDLLDGSGPFEPGREYYFHPVNRGGPDTEYTINGGWFCPQGHEAVEWEGEISCAPICEEGYQLEREGDGWICVRSECPEGQEEVEWEGEIVCAPICAESYQLEREGDGWICVCPEGQEEVGWEGEIMCAPICRDGYELEREGDGWTCVKSPDGCGCAAGGSASGLGLLGLVLLALGLRRRI